MVCPRRTSGSATHGLRTVVIELALRGVGAHWLSSVCRCPGVSKTVGSRRTVRILVRLQLWLLSHRRASPVNILLNRSRIGRDVGGVCTRHARAPRGLERGVHGDLLSAPLRLLKRNLTLALRLPGLLLRPATSGLLAVARGRHIRERPSSSIARSLGRWPAIRPPAQVLSPLRIAPRVARRHVAELCAAVTLDRPPAASGRPSPFLRRSPSSSCTAGACCSAR